jgi:4-amino-4-deoxy-L-arabinose transferase-like glycosyltransferase
VSRRELLLLVPLLALYLVAWAFFPARPDDEASYVALAERLTEGYYVTGNDDALLDPEPDSPDLWFGPGLPTLLAPLAALDAPLWLLRLTGPALLFAAVILFFSLVRDTWGPRLGLGAAYALGLYLPFLGLLSNLHSEVLAIALVCAAMLCLARLARSGGAIWLVGSAAALAALALTRVAYGWVLTVALVVLVLVWLVSRSRAAGRAGAAIGLALVLCLPWLTYTYANTDRLFVWGNSGSLSLYWMASPHDGDLGDWHQAHLVFTDPALEPHRAFFDGLRGMSLAEQNAEIEREALRNIAEHPAAYAQNVAANVSRMLFNLPYSRTEEQLNDVFYVVPNTLVLFAVALCVVVLIPRRRRLPPETGAFVVLAAVAFLLHALVATYPRMLMPLLPFAVWLTMLALVELGLLKPGAPRRRPTPTGTS